MSDTSSSIMFVAVPKQNPIPPPTPPSSSVSRQNSESQSFVYEPAVMSPHFISPTATPEGLGRRSRFDVHVRPPNPLRPTMIRSRSANIAALHRLYQSGVHKKNEKMAWVEEEMRKRERTEVAACTFRPELSAFASKLLRPRQLSPEYRFREEIEAKEQIRAKKRMQQEREGLRECTFHPLTLRAVRLDPRGFVSRKDRYSVLYEDAATRKELRERFVDVLQSETKLKESLPLLEQEELDLVGRLSRPVQRPSPEPEKFEPEINVISERLVASIRARDDSPKSIVERLFNGTTSIRSRSPQAHDLHSFVPELNPKSIELLLQKQISHLSRLFGQLSGGRDTSGVIELARSAVNTLSLSDAEDVVSILRTARQSTLSRVDFIDLCLKPEFAAKKVTQAPALTDNARQEAKRNPKNNTTFEDPSFHPRIDPHSESIVRDRGSLSRLYTAKTKKRDFSTESQTHSFRPKINPLPSYIVNMRRNANAAVHLSGSNDAESNSAHSDSHVNLESAYEFPEFGDRYSETQIAERYGYSSSPASSGGARSLSTSEQKLPNGSSLAESPPEEDILALLEQRRAMRRSPF